MFGISAGEFVVLLAVAAVVLGPERLPDYARQLARLIRELRKMAQGAGAKVREEMGPEFDEIDWRKLDPRQYDPRRIVREALSDAFDPDDPLGLKDLDDETAALQKPVSRERPLSRERPVSREKPVSPGGPAEAQEAAAQRAVQDGAAFDPDAT